MLIKVCWDADNTYDAIAINSGKIEISNNMIYSNLGNKPRYGVYINNQYGNMVTNNRIEGTSTYDIYLVTGGSNLVEGNICGGQVSLPGRPGDIYKNNIGFVTENYGYNTSVSNSDTIPHGLDITPTVIIITPTGNVTVWVTAITATTFTVGLPTGSYNLYWYAIYKP
jgi:hypothetical protein